MIDDQLDAVTALTGLPVHELLYPDTNKTS